MLLLLICNSILNYVESYQSPKLTKIKKESSSNKAILETGKCGNDVSYVLENGILQITGSGPMTNYSLLEQEWDKCNSDVSSIIIENGVTTIGSYSFLSFVNLKSITIAESIISIGDFSFCNCTSLKSITIPNNVQTIGNSSFFNCWSLISVDISKSI